MRSFLIAFGIGLLLISCATLPPIPEEQANYSKTYETTLSKAEVYNKSLEWIAKTFRSAKAVIEFQDKDQGKIIGNGSVDCPIGPVQTLVSIGFTLTIEAKEGKYRMVFENIRMVFGPGDTYPLRRDYDVKNVHLKLQSLCDAFQNYLTIKAENW